MATTDHDATLPQVLLDVAREFPDRVALEVQGTEVTYRELLEQSLRIASAVQASGSPPGQPVGILAARSVTAYCGILGAHLAGRAYVPLNPDFPTARLAAMLRGAAVGTLVVGKEGKATLAALGACSPAADKTIFLEASDEPLPGALVADSIAPLADPVPVSLDDTAYIMFTSGTTGRPKGVPVSFGNVGSYVRYVVKRYGVRPEDRASQTFDLTFDLSVHDLFVTWAAGACLCVLPRREVMGPARFIRNHLLTLWFSVPSVALFMSRLHQLKPGSLPTLRCSLFCGEPLTAVTASRWQAAAPNSIVENLYGPTEATIAITHFRWRADAEELCVNGIVPIGSPFAGQKVLVVDDHLCPVQDGEPGELCLVGSQVTRGYLDAPEKTAQQFVRINGRRCYRTGDLVRNQGGCLQYLGRIDDQVQLRGHRVELQEVEHVLREMSADASAVCVPLGLQAGRADSLVAVITRSQVDPQDVLEACRERLPSYMVPSRVVVEPSLPLNPNGKVDRRALAVRMEESL